jgi:uncharacterized protein YuzE
MKVTYDDEAKALYLSLKEIKPGEAYRSIPLGGGIYLDVDIYDKPVGIEMLCDFYDDKSREILLEHFDINKKCMK